MSVRLPLEDARTLLASLQSLEKAHQLYPPGHAAVQRTRAAMDVALDRAFARGEPILVAVAEGYLVVGDNAFLHGSAQAAELARRLSARGIEGVILEPRVRAAELDRFLEWLGTESAGDWSGTHVTLTRVKPEGAAWAKGRRLHEQAVDAVAGACGEVEEGRIPDAGKAQECVAAFSELLDENPGILSGLVLLKDYDQYTYYHSVNVCLLALGLAKQLAVSAAELEWVGIGGLFHDIGKTRTPLEVIRKPGRLSHTEASIMRWHPVYGRDILLQMSGLPAPVPRLVYEHHMRFDGGGYPIREEGEPLHSLTPLITAADVYDAMTTHRPYSLPLPLPAAVKTMAALSGTHLAPAAFEAFLALLGPIPVGSLVRLATGEVAVVTKLGAGGAVGEVLVSSGVDGMELREEDCVQRSVGPSDVAGWVATLTRKVDPFRAVSRAS